MSAHQLSYIDSILFEYKTYVENHGSGNNVLYTIILNAESYAAILEYYKTLYDEEAILSFMKDVKSIHRHTTVMVDFVQHQKMRILQR